MTILKNKQTRMITSESWFGQKALNPVREIIESPRIKKLINVTKDKNKPLLPLSIGDPTVFGNLKTPNVFIKGITEAAQDLKNHGYLPSNGKLETREAIAKRYSYPQNILTNDDVLLGSGCSGALEILFKSMLNPRSQGGTRKILLPSPGFPLYETLLNSFDIPFEKYSLLEESNWEIDLKQVDRMIQEDNTITAVLITNPSNPTGSVYSQSHLEDLLKVARKWGVIVVADEIYGDITFEPNQFHPIASLMTETLDVPVVSVGGIAKEFLVPGFRVGWILFYGAQSNDLKAIKNGAKRLSMLILGPNSLIQAAIPSLFDKKNKEEIDGFKETLVTILSENAEYLFDRFSKIKSKDGRSAFSLNRSQGSMYIFIKILAPQNNRTNYKRAKIDKFSGDSVAFMEALLEKEQVFVLPGTAFGSNVTDCFRLTLTPPRDVLKDACDRIENFVSKYF